MTRDEAIKQTLDQIDETVEQLNEIEDQIKTEKNLKKKIYLSIQSDGIKSQIFKLGRQPLPPKEGNDNSYFE